MSTERLLELLEAYGGDPDHWPENERIFALKRLENPEFDQDLEEAQRLDNHFDHLLFEEKAVPASLLAQIADIPEIHAQTAPPVSLRVTPKILISNLIGLAAAFVMGLYIGTSGLPGSADQAAESVDLLYAESDDYIEEDEIEFTFEEPA